ncbi:MAG: hypothetical protein LBP59_19060 [Planctomycetaceae bacterium]|nr:hypothetical protein [Planctomycetaceae bacterium]
MNRGNILEDYESIFKRAKLLGSWVAYDSNKLRYSVTDNIYLLPSVTAPKIPIYGAYFSHKKMLMRFLEYLVD